jgi:hypothetical protein
MHCLAVCPSHRHLEPPRPRPPPPVTAVCPCRRSLRPNFGHPYALGELMVVPNHLPGRECRRLAGIGRSRAAPMAKGSIASPQIFLGCSVQSRGTIVKIGKDLGTPLQKVNFNSKRTLPILVKSLENLRKIGKMQTPFC